MGDIGVGGIGILTYCIWTYRYFSTPAYLVWYQVVSFSLMAIFPPWIYENHTIISQRAGYPTLTPLGGGGGRHIPCSDPTRTSRADGSKTPSALWTNPVRQNHPAISPRHVHLGVESRLIYGVAVLYFNCKRTTTQYIYMCKYARIQLCVCACILLSMRIHLHVPIFAFMPRVNRWGLHTINSFY